MGGDHLWDAIGAIGEIVGAAGVIVTLIYLALQIRQNSKDVRAATRQSVSTIQAEIGLKIASDPVLRASAGRWLAGETESSDPTDLLVDDIFIRANLRMYENQFHQNRERTFTDDVWSGYAESMYRTMSFPIFHQWWERNRSLYSSDFAAFVDKQVARSKEEGPQIDAQ